MRELTSAQFQVLRFISTFREEHGYPPTIREIMLGFGWASTNSVTTHLRALEHKGMITNRPGEARTLVLTAKGFFRIGTIPTVNNNLPRLAPPTLAIAFAEEAS